MRLIAALKGQIFRPGSLRVYTSFNFEFLKKLEDLFHIFSPMTIFNVEKFHNLSDCSIGETRSISALNLFDHYYN